MSDDIQSRWCHGDHPRFQDALTFTAAQTGFSARLIEKDYFCSLVLHDLADLFDQGLIFKGGTCLSKVHATFFRLSEDLDFCVSISPEASRPRRRESASSFKVHLGTLPARHAVFQAAEEIKAYNALKQYSGLFGYRSCVTGESEHIKIELSLREHAVLPTIIANAHTLLRDPLSGAAFLPPVPVRVLQLHEAYAEKIRAALTRRDPAIRDFFDIAYAAKNSLFDYLAPAMLELVSKKLAIPGNDAVDLSPAKIAGLQGQVATQLRPVLREADYDAFDLDHVVAVLAELMKHGGIA